MSSVCFVTSSEHSIPLVFLYNTPLVLLQDTPLVFLYDTPLVLLQDTPLVLLQDTPLVFLYDTPLVLLQDTPLVFLYDTPLVLLQDTPLVFLYDTPLVYKTDFSPFLGKNKRMLRLLLYFSNNRDSRVCGWLIFYLFFAVNFNSGFTTKLQNEEQCFHFCAMEKRTA